MLPPNETEINVEDRRMRNRNSAKKITAETVWINDRQIHLIKLDTCVHRIMKYTEGNRTLRQ